MHANMYAHRTRDVITYNNDETNVTMSRRKYEYTNAQIREMSRDEFINAFACDNDKTNARCTYDAHDDARTLHVNAFHVDNAQTHRNNTSTWCRMCQRAYDDARTRALRICNDATTYNVRTLRDINAIDDDNEHARIRAMYDDEMTRARSRRYSRERHN